MRIRRNREGDKAYMRIRWNRGGGKAYMRTDGIEREVRPI
jgi:hypothetical protein